ncbi:cysteine hydrolase [Kaistia dalseonensis]|uniref:Ureidoacrylate peracid hydrolase n=1 Tax=Kaistia dalseonensis TaxID=410840 RepID=A0ABU0HF59_9HYPH|nr:cysteine hydrolase [Kaistia dalseonensis]MCX5497844.1 cysteine hydrolase [Kaistia dalseonensis]MDQ0440488.1 ureidoacrylate peracid hydrolase [Kaistia dalseonensis]
MHTIAIDPETLERVTRWRGKDHMFEDIDPARTALVVIDMQNGFTEAGSEMEVPESREIVPNINRLSAAMAEAGGLNVFVYFVVDDETPKNWSTWLGYFCTAERGDNAKALFAPGAHGGAIASDLVVRPGDLMVPKSRFSALVPGSSDLHAQLQARGIDTVIITGTVTNCCCESTARDAMQMDYKVIFVADGTAALSDADHNATLNNMVSIFADVMTTDEIVGFLAAAPQRIAAE